MPRTIRASRDEVTRLAVTFNQMLAQLQGAYDEQEYTLASQRRFVADASHELRTPLATIRTNLELLQRAGDDLPAADRDEAMADAIAEIQRLSRLVGDLLTLARVDSGLRLERRDEIEVDRLVRDVYRQARLMAMPREHTVVADPIQEATVLGDADYLKELLLILVDNAIQYTPDGGEIRLGVEAARWSDGRDGGTRSSSASRTTAWGSTPRTSPTCSSGSTAPTAPATATPARPAGPASASRSRSGSPRSTTAGSRSRASWGAAPPSRCACPSTPLPPCRPRSSPG